MKLMLDTHTFLWFIAGDAKLSQYTKELIENQDNQRHISSSALWEITIKSSMGRLVVPTPMSELIQNHILANGIDILTISPKHLDTLHSLPYHHKDPFDRLIIAQSICEDMVILTKDTAFDHYPVQTMWNQP